jgi:hypothetical protein
MRTAEKSYSFRTVVLILLASVGLSSCGFYKLSQGGNFPAEVTSIHVDFFNNKANIIAPTLSPSLTDKLRDKFLSESKLNLTDNEPSLNLSGHITGYDVEAVASKDNSTATLNRLRITVHAKLVSDVAEKFNFEQDFVKFLEFDAAKSLSEVENDLIDEITDMLVQEIFNKVAMDW